MRVGYVDVLKAVNDANTILASIASDDELLISSNYDLVSIASKNSITGVEVLIIDNGYREEAYRWLDGFITAGLIVRPTILEEKNDFGYNTVNSQQDSVPVKMNKAWWEKVMNFIDIY
jgi:hypothetical protein